MKKIIILLISFAALSFLLYWLSNQYKYNSTKYFEDNILLSNQSIDSAHSFLHTKPDSAIMLYNSAIKRLETFPADSKIRHQLATVYFDLSTVYLPKAAYEKAKELRNKALKIAGKHDLDIQANVLWQDGLTCYQQSQYNEALKLYEKAGILAQKTTNHKLQTQIISCKAILYYNLGNVNMGVAGFNKVLKLGKELKDTSLISDAFINFGIVYMDQLSYSHARECFTKASVYYQKNKQFDDLIVCYRNLGNVNFKMEKYEDAINWYQKSLQIALALDNKAGIAKGYHNIGEVYLLIGDSAQANKAFTRAQKIKESIGDKASLANEYRSRGNLYFIQKKFSNSLFYQQKALKIDIGLKLIKEQANDYANISTIYGETGDIAKAITYCQKAIVLAKEGGDTSGVGVYACSLGKLQLLQKNYDQAESYFLKSVSIKENQSDQEGAVPVYCLLAQLYANKPVSTDKRKSNLMKALAFGLRANKLAEHVQVLRLKLDVSYELSEIYKKLNNYAKAYRYLAINKKMHDSIFNKTKMETLAFAEARWNNEMKKQQIQDLEKINQAITEQKAAEANQHKTLVFGLILIFILIAFVVALYGFYDSKKREVRHQRQLSRISLLRLQNIRNRISPHFIFNILNREIHSEIDTEKQKEMTGLVKFLRRSLEITEQTSVSLDEELDFVRNYLQMEQPSLGGNFETCWEIDERIEMKQFRIPAMVMQIPVENALKHALRGKEGEKRLSISLTQLEWGVLIIIQDNGNGYFPDKACATKGTGIGLNVLYQTIQLMNSKNDKKIKFDILNRNGESTSGTKVEISVPVEYNYEF